MMKQILTVLIALIALAGISTVSAEQTEIKTMSSPALGVGYRGSVEGDLMPVLYTYKDMSGNHVTTETRPADHERDGSMIVTPSRVTGESLSKNTYYDTAKGQRYLEWLYNSRKAVVTKDHTNIMKRAEALTREKYKSKEKDDFDLLPSGTGQTREPTVVHYEAGSVIGGNGHVTDIRYG